MYTLEQIAEEVFTLKGSYNGITSDVKEIKRQQQDLYNKTERDKTELIERIERGNASLKTELVYRIERGNASLKTEFVDRILTTKTELIQWIIGLLIGFTAVIISAVWAMLSFAIK